MKKLSTEEKLSIIDRSIMQFEAGEAKFICISIAYKLEQSDFFPPSKWRNAYITASDIALAVIPELMKIKPDNTLPGSSWFGSIENKTLRIEKLKELREIIKNQTT
jgi:hypothetical protein